VAGALALLVAAVTVSGQALRAARTNPAQALRDE
jgi:ABC-type antimicrobial peptide transport system permease subunit